MLPQNKISGTAIAWGKGKWSDLGDGEMGYVFDRDDSFAYQMPQAIMDQNGVTDDDLYDCITQIEKRLGSPEEYAKTIGLFPNSGFTHPGIVVHASNNDQVLCVFTPMLKTDGDADGYFQWYFEKGGLDLTNMHDFMTKFDMLSGNREMNVADSPQVPSYGEAMERTTQWGVKEEVRDQLLRLVWNFHKTTFTGAKRKFAEDIMKIWKPLLEAQKIINDQTSRKVMESQESDEESLNEATGVPKWMLRKVRNPQTGNMVQVRSLPPEEREKYNPRGKERAAAKDKAHKKQVAANVAATQHDTAQRLSQARTQELKDKAAAKSDADKTPVDANAVAREKGIKDAHAVHDEIKRTGFTRYDDGKINFLNSGFKDTWDQKMASGEIKQGQARSKKHANAPWINGYITPDTKDDADWEYRERKD